MTFDDLLDKSWGKNTNTNTVQLILNLLNEIDFKKLWKWVNCVWGK